MEQDLCVQEERAGTPQTWLFNLIRCVCWLHPGIKLPHSKCRDGVHSGGSVPSSGCAKSVGTVWRGIDWNSTCLARLSADLRWEPFDPVCDCDWRSAIRAIRTRLSSCSLGCSICFLRVGRLRSVHAIASSQLGSGRRVQWSCWSCGGQPDLFVARVWRSRVSWWASHRKIVGFDCRSSHSLAGALSARAGTH